MPKTKPKLALLCGNLLFAGYVEVFHILKESFDITAFSWDYSDLPSNGINLNCEKVRSLESFLPPTFGPTRLLLRQLSRQIGSKFVPGFESRLKQFDVLYCQELYPPWTQQAIHCKLRHGNKVVIQTVENLPFRREEENGCATAKRNAYQHADLLIAPTEQARGVCIAEGANVSKIQVIPLAVDVDRFCPSSKSPVALAEIGCGPDDLIVLYVGRLLWMKGILDFVEAAALLDKRMGDEKVKFVMVGDGQEQNLLNKYVSFYGLQDTVKILSSRDYSAMPRVFNCADVVVIPSSICATWEEQFGMVLVESMACGKAVVTTKTGAIPEVVGENAVLVPCHAPEALADAIQRLLEAPAERARLGQHGRIWVEQRYSVNVVCNQLERALLDLVAE